MFCWSTDLGRAACGWREAEGTWREAAAVVVFWDLNHLPKGLRRARLQLDQICNPGARGCNF